jgi:hypothetical protein
MALFAKLYLFINLSVISAEVIVKNALFLAPPFLTIPDMIACPLLQTSVSPLRSHPMGAERVRVAAGSGRPRYYLKAQLVLEGL